METVISCRQIDSLVDKIESDFSDRELRSSDENPLFSYHNNLISEVCHFQSEKEVVDLTEKANGHLVEESVTCKELLCIKNAAAAGLTSTSYTLLEEKEPRENLGIPREIEECLMLPTTNSHVETKDKLETQMQNLAHKINQENSTNESPVCGAIDSNISELTSIYQSDPVQTRIQETNTHYDHGLAESDLVHDKGHTPSESLHRLCCAKESTPVCSVDKASCLRIPTLPCEMDNLQLRVNWFHGHLADVCSLDVFENFLLSGGGDTSLKLWIKSNQEEFKSFGGHSGTITGSLFMKDKPFHRYPQAVSSSVDCSIKTWNLEKGHIIKSIYVYSPVLHLDYCAGQALVGTEAGKVEIYDLESGNCTFSVQAHDHPVSAVKFLPDGKISSGSVDGIVKIFHPSSGDPGPVLLSTAPDLSVKTLVDDDAKTDAAMEIREGSARVNKISCIVPWRDSIIFSDGGYDLKVWNIEEGCITKLRTNLNEFCPTEAVCISCVGGVDYLFTASSDVDSGDSYINMRSLPDLAYVGTIRDTQNCSGHITCLAACECDVGLQMVSGGSQLRLWTQTRIVRGRKRKGSDEEFIVPCKYLRKFTGSRESDSESEPPSGSPVISRNNHSAPSNRWCIIL